MKTASWTKGNIWSRLLCICIMVYGCKIPLAAQDTVELLDRIKAMEDRIKSLEAEVAALKAHQGEQPAVAAPAPVETPTTTVTPVAAQPPVEAPQLGGAGAAAAKALNPDISVIGNFLGGVGYGANRTTPSLEMHESEVGFQAIIDPYARGDFFLTFGEQGVGLEEGYITFTALPGGLQLKAGKMRGAFGVVNTQHSHVLPWTDRPLVTQNLVGGEDGISDAGLSISRILPAPKNIFLEGTAQVFRGDTEGVYRSNRRSDVSTIGHLRAYRDLSESANLTLGASYSHGHSFWGDGSNELYGLDATFRWKPLRRAIYHSFVGRSEFVWARATMNSVAGPVMARPFGYYISADYQFRRRWFVGGRFDHSGRFTIERLTDTGGSVVLTYWPSEFSQIRGQLRQTRYGEKLTANELLFQFSFALGAHGAHPF